MKASSNNHRFFVSWPDSKNHADPGIKVVRKTGPETDQPDRVLGRPFPNTTAAAREGTIGKRFAYVRTSTVDQHNGLDAQIDAILRYDPEVDRRDIFIEQTSGGIHHSKRPKLHALLNQIEAGDIIYCHRIDRIGRSTLDLLTIVEKIKQAGARFISIQDGIDTQSGIVADVFLTVLSSIATYERQLVSERTRSSLQVLKDQGVQLGRPRKITPTLIRQVQTMHDDPSISVKDVCTSLGISRTSYYSALRQPQTAVG